MMKRNHTSPTYRLHINKNTATNGLSHKRCYLALHVRCLKLQRNAPTRPNFQSFLSSRSISLRLLRFSRTITSRSLSFRKRIQITTENSALDKKMKINCYSMSRSSQTAGSNLRLKNVTINRIKKTQPNFSVSHVTSLHHLLTKTPHLSRSQRHSSLSSTLQKSILLSSLEKLLIRSVNFGIKFVSIRIGLIQTATAVATSTITAIS